MGWTISHAPYDETLSRSALQLHNLARYVADSTSSRDWRSVKPMFDQAEHADGPFAFGWAQAGRIADVLRLAAADARMPRDWADFASKLAAAADRAASRRELWRWR